MFSSPIIGGRGVYSFMPVDVIIKAMNDKYPQSVQEELAALAGKSDEDIDFSDIPATTEHDWAGAVRGKFYCSETALHRKPLEKEQRECSAKA